MKTGKVKRMLWMSAAAIGSIILLLTGVLLGVSGIFRSPAYLEPWEKEYARQFQDPRLQAAAHGLLAANGHNMQPWKIRLDRGNANVFYLYADSSRLTPEVDPLNRQMMVTQGAFLEYVRTAGAELGYAVDIGLFPNGPYDEEKLAESMDLKAVAKITLRKEASSPSPLYSFMFRPDTNRGPYREAALTDRQAESLGSLGTEKLAVEVFRDEDNLRRLSGYVMEAAQAEAGVSRVMEESERIFRANEYEKNRYRYGFSMEGQGTTGFLKHVMQGIVTLFPSMNRGQAASDRFVQSAQAAADHTPAYAVIRSRDNSRESQVESGMLYSRLVLQAHELGLAVQPLSQALEEYPEMAAVYQAIHRDYAPQGSILQMLVRVGQPVKEAPLSMRRDVTELLGEDL
ncbi:Acg family FMN-binding oxidoreductase [Paenibacillus sp. YN15]|uniref:Acg family FMN-binding oxidoreductase n=1 Tax=Paenibacillus sp. YN15 TaxID=1742774 RepID=UPI000DCEE5D2|nr:nitroreductase family protein [Paenibacillus sp. YN15]RAV05625.1 hypothetical protein DQG13_03140 [Paenibacillus sp. YN15]